MSKVILFTLLVNFCPVALSFLLSFRHANVLFLHRMQAESDMDADFYEDSSEVDRAVREEQIMNLAPRIILQEIPFINAMNLKEELDTIGVAKITDLLSIQQTVDLLACINDQLVVSKSLVGDLAGLNDYFGVSKAQNNRWDLKLPMSTIVKQTMSHLLRQGTGIYDSLERTHNTSSNIISRILTHSLPYSMPYPPLPSLPVVLGDMYTAVIGRYDSLECIYNTLSTLIPHILPYLPVVLGDTLQLLVGNEARIMELAAFVTIKGAGRQIVHSDTFWSRLPALYTCTIALQDVEVDRPKRYYCILLKLLLPSLLLVIIVIINIIIVIVITINVSLPPTSIFACRKRWVPPFSFLLLIQKQPIYNAP